MTSGVLCTIIKRCMITKGVTEMIQSMTGFGRGEVLNKTGKIELEMKSVNHRYLDVNIRLPRKLNIFESEIRNQVKQFASRGKIDLYLTFSDLSGEHSHVTYNKEVAEAYLAEIRQLSRDLRLEDKTTAFDISKFPDVFTTEEEKLDEDGIRSLITAAIQSAGEQFLNSRRAEGKKLQEDLLQKLDRVRVLVEAVSERAPLIIQEYRNRIQEKVTELLGSAQIDEGVLATELVVFADKICVDEEMVRLRTHIIHMQETLKEGGSVGRKLDFLTQEMNREANTILSKTNDIEVSNYGIELKTEIEKIREQIQNIE